jgi:nitronate monooxygenase
VAARPNGNPILRYSSSLPVEGMTGEIEALSLYAGQSVGLVGRVEPAARIVAEVVREAEAVLAGLAGPR